MTFVGSSEMNSTFGAQSASRRRTTPRHGEVLRGLAARCRWDQRGLLQKGFSMACINSRHLMAGALALALLHCQNTDGRRPSSAATYRSETPMVSNTEEFDQDESEGMTPAAGTDVRRREQASPGALGTDEEMRAPSIALSDSRIAAISDAANSAEVEHAAIALDRAKDSRVRTFAQLMADHHGQAKRDQQELMARLDLTAAASSRSEQLRAEAASTRNMLNRADDGDFDRTYIDSQVDAHQKVLGALDRELIPSAQNSELKQMLESMRVRVESHLREARELQRSLASPRAKQRPTSEPPSTPPAGGPTGGGGPAGP
jgi:putative membrane protein